MGDSSVMRVVHLSTSETKGGAAIAAKRLVEAQRASGLDASLLVLNRQTEDSFVHTLIPEPSSLAKRIRKYRELWATYLRNGRKLDHTLFATSYPVAGFNLRKSIESLQPDLIHLHWINQGFLSIASLERLAGLGKPLVWTLHDLWPVTAVAHHTPDVNGWMNAEHRSLAYRMGSRKADLYAQAKPCFVGCSRWISDEARKSRLTTGCLVRHITNAADVSFHPFPQKEARNRLGIPENGSIVLFGAANAQDPRKGYLQLIETMRALQQVQNIPLPRIMVFGKADEATLRKDLNGFEIHFAGYVNRSEQMNLLYAASDLFFTPSLEENLPNTIIEAQLSGTPSVAFAVGGIPEIIDSPQAGRLVPPFDCRFAAQAIADLLEKNDSLDREALHQNAEHRYHPDRIAQAYIDLYASFI